MVPSATIMDWTALSKGPIPAPGCGGTCPVTGGRGLGAAAAGAAIFTSGLFGAVAAHDDSNATISQVGARFRFPAAITPTLLTFSTRYTSA
jgi:hypothetical protein